MMQGQAAVLHGILLYGPILPVRIPPTLRQILKGNCQDS